MLIDQIHDLSSLHLASRLNIAEVLGDQELTATEIVSKCSPKINPEKLARHLRHLCNLHIFRELRPNVFANNAVSILIKSPGLRAMIEHT